MKKIVRWIVVLVGLAAIVGGSFAGGFATGQRYMVMPKAETIIVTPEDVDSFKPLIEMWAVLQNRFYGELPPVEEFVEGAIEGGIEKLPGVYAEYTYYHTPEETKLLDAMGRGEFGGIGIYFTKEGSEMVVTYVKPGGPADQAGMKANDVITHVDGEPITGVRALKWRILLMGDVGSVVKITVFRLGEGALELEVTRDVVDMPVVESKVIDQDGIKIGYVFLENFEGKCVDDMRAALNELLKEEGVNGLIVDVRGNPGGRLDYALTITSFFVPGGRIAYQYKSPTTTTPIATKSGGMATDIPLVILVDNGSASAAELYASSIKDNKRGTIVGTPTMGKGVGQQPIKLSDGGEFAPVSFEWLTPNGDSILGVGVEPDEFVPTSPHQRMRGQDPALDRAIEILLEEIAK